MVVPLVWINTYAHVPMRSDDGVSDSQWVAAVCLKTSVNRSIEAFTLVLVTPTRSVIAGQYGMAIVIAGHDGMAIVMARARIVAWSL